MIKLALLAPDNLSIKEILGDEVRRIVMALTKKTLYVPNIPDETAYLVGGGQWRVVRFRSDFMNQLIVTDNDNPFIHATEEDAGYNLNVPISLLEKAFNKVLTDDCAQAHWKSKLDEIERVVSYDNLHVRLTDRYSIEDARKQLADIKGWAHPDLSEWIKDPCEHSMSKEETRVRTRLMQIGQKWLSKVKGGIVGWHVYGKKKLTIYYAWSKLKNSERLELIKLSEGEEMRFSAVLEYLFQEEFNEQWCVELKAIQKEQPKLKERRLLVGIHCFVSENSFAQKDASDKISLHSLLSDTWSEANGAISELDKLHRTV
jgi:hypothetical protein